MLVCVTRLSPLPPHQSWFSCCSLISLYVDMYANRGLAVTQLSHTVAAALGEWELLPYYSKYNPHVEPSVTPRQAIFTSRLI